MGQSDFVLSILDLAAAAVPGVLGVYDVEGGRLIPCGRTAVDLLGYTPEQIAGLDSRGLRALVHSQDRARLDALLRRASSLEQGRSDGEEVRVKHADGSWRPVRLQASVFARGPDGEPVVLVGTATPLSALSTLQARAAAPADGKARKVDGHDGAEVLETLLEHVPESVIVSGGEPELPVIAQSRSARELFGRPLARVADLPARGRGPHAAGLYEADGAGVPALEETPAYRAARFGETVEGEEWMVRRPDGSCAAVDVEAVPVRSGGAVVGVVSTWRDATVRKQLEAAVREKAEQLALLIRCTRAGWWRYELESGVLILSGECRDLLAWPPERESSREAFLQAVHPADRPRAAAVFDGSRLECDRFELELRILQPDGEERWASLATDCHSDDLGRPLNLFAVMMDITDRKRVESALWESEERFRKLAREVGWSSRPPERQAHPTGRKSAK